MSDETTVKTVPFNARILSTDKEFIEDLMKGHATKAEGFSAFIEQYKKGLNTPDPVTIPMVLQPGQVIISFNPEHNLEAKLKAMRRWLKNKEKIPADCTEEDFLNNLIETLILAHISKHFEFLNRSQTND
jgi:hypothetical protein